MNDYSQSYKVLADSLGVPLIPKRKAPNRIDTNGPVAVCGECGVTVYRVMAYSCPHQNCPCGLGSAGSLCLNNNELSGSLK
jgi:hypothetical protein